MSAPTPPPGGRAGRRVVVTGPVYCDLVFGGVERLPDWGEEVFAPNLVLAPGGSAITAVALARLGHHVALAAAIGDDALGAVLRSMLQAHGVDLDELVSRPGGATPVTAAMACTVDRAFVTHLGVGADPVDVAAAIVRHRASHLHVAGFPAVLATPTIARDAQAAGVTVSFDPGWDERALAHPDVRALARDADVVLPNRLEAARLLGVEAALSARELLTRLAASRPSGLSVVKDGPSGAWGTAGDAAGDAAGGPAVAHAAAPTVTAIDPTGAGDVFDAGFLDAWWEGASLERCLERGTWFGARATTAYGGVAATPTRRDWEATA